MGGSCALGRPRRTGATAAPPRRRAAAFGRAKPRLAGRSHGSARAQVLQRRAAGGLPIDDLAAVRASRAGGCRVIVVVARRFAGQQDVQRMVGVIVPLCIVAGVQQAGIVVVVLQIRWMRRRGVRAPAGWRATRPAARPASLRPRWHARHRDAAHRNGIHPANSARSR